MNFYMVVYHPYKPLPALFADCEANKEFMETTWYVYTWVTKSCVSTIIVCRVTVASAANIVHRRRLVNDSYHTDLSLLYAPYIIALGSLYLAAFLTGVDLRAWFTDLNVDMKEVCYRTTRFSWAAQTHWNRYGKWAKRYWTCTNKPWTWATQTLCWPSCQWSLIMQKCKIQHNQVKGWFYCSVCSWCTGDDKEWRWWPAACTTLWSRFTSREPPTLRDTNIEESGVHSISGLLAVFTRKFLELARKPRTCQHRNYTANHSKWFHTTTTMTELAPAPITTPTKPRREEDVPSLDVIEGIAIFVTVSLSVCASCELLLTVASRKPTPCLFAKISSNTRATDFACALQDKIILQGRMYVTEQHIHFSSVFVKNPVCIAVSWWLHVQQLMHVGLWPMRQQIKIAFKDIVQLVKRNTLVVFPNAIEVITRDGAVCYQIKKHPSHCSVDRHHADKSSFLQYLFTSFIFRDQTFKLLWDQWEKNRTVLELRQWPHFSHAHLISDSQGSAAVNGEGQNNSGAGDFNGGNDSRPAAAAPTPDATVTTPSPPTTPDAAPSSSAEPSNQEQAANSATNGNNAPTAVETKDPIDSLSEGRSFRQDQDTTEF